MKRLLLLSTCFVIAGCQTPIAPPTGSSDLATTQFIDTHTTLARKSEASGDPTEALRHWQVINMVAEDKSESQQQIRKLRRSIRSQLKSLEQQLESQTSERARQATALAILALDGKHRKARAALQKIEETYIWKEQSEALARRHKPRETQSPTVAVKPRISPRDLNQVVAALTAGDLDRAFLDASKLPEGEASSKLKTRVADALFRRGQQRVRTDIQGAIDDFARTLTLAPDHVRAKHEHTRTQKIAENLERIRSGN